MFSERFDALMNIAEVSNSLLGRDIHMNPSYIGRLRSGARPLPKKHDYIHAICRYLANHMKKDYQVNAVCQLLNIDAAVFGDMDAAVVYLEDWLLERDRNTQTVTDRFISAFSLMDSGRGQVSGEKEAGKEPEQFEEFLYGNAGKRKAVEQFFLKVLQEDKPGELLLFSDENMEWLYEDRKFTERWTELFTKVILKGNRVRIIHTVSRDINEMLEAVNKWLPIYMTGMVEPYFYPRIRDSVFQRTLFIAPNTAAVASSSVQHDTSEMLNLFLTEPEAIGALCREYERYFNLCRPLMKIYTEKDMPAFRDAFYHTGDSEGAVIYCCSMPPLFALPEELASKLFGTAENGSLFDTWKTIRNSFANELERKKIHLILMNPDDEQMRSEEMQIPEGEIFSVENLTCSRADYLAHIDHVRELAKQHENLKVTFRSDVIDNMSLCVREDSRVIMVRKNEPKVAFAMDERNIVSAFWDYFANLCD